MSISEKLTQIAENEQRVFDAGKQAEYDTFWDAYQDNGNRTDYSGAFSGDGWSDVLVKPKHPIKPTSARNMFFYNHTNLDISGMGLDFSICTDFTDTFSNCNVRIGVVDVRACKTLTRTFSYNSKGASTYIEKLIVNESNVFSNTFVWHQGLVDITIEGTIGNSISFINSPLSAESAKSVILALGNYAGTDMALANTVTFSSTTLAALEAEGATSPSGTTWADYVVEKGWNI